MVPRSPLKSGNNKMMLGESVATDTVQEAKKSNVTGGNPDGTVKGIADDFTITSETPEKDADGSLAIIVKKTAPDPIKLTINTTVAGGQSVGGVPVTIKMTAMNRQKKSDTVTVKLETEEGVLTGNADSYTGHTDEKGNLVINVTDPDGLGTRTTLSITVNDGAKQLTKTQDVIFTVLTSPDIPLANYWGHMEKTVNDGSNTFYRPLLAKEIDSTLSILTWERNNELWGAAQWNRINNYCQNNLGANLPTIVEAKKLAEVNLSSPEHYLYTHYGWPVNTKKAFFIWTSELDPNTLSISIIGLNNNQASDSGSKNAGGGGRYIIICRK
ncbi:putative outer membrane protein [Xenorhabdus vietnamensis]|uniref:Putative outer membrane protein n=2 Tax=Xenorhabdus vietnamensis TaxID=351656 RepID=A0A1Y2SHF6_9GAMM|nr:putative outer membrane protein [Xenorhabdus vietnamensis]